MNDNSPDYFGQKKLSYCPRKKYNDISLLISLEKVVFRTPLEILSSFLTPHSSIGHFSHSLRRPHITTVHFSHSLRGGEVKWSLFLEMFVEDIDLDAELASGLQEGPQRSSGD